MEERTNGDESGPRRGSESLRALILGILCGIIFTTLCGGAGLASFLWYHQMFIIGVNRRGEVLLSILFVLICVGVGALITAIRRSLIQ
jgi:hypothetical protein